MKTKARPGRKRLYDWKRLFQRTSFVLWRGRDYRCTSRCMAQQVRNAASHLGLSAHVKHQDGAVFVGVSEVK